MPTHGQELADKPLNTGAPAGRVSPMTMGTNGCRTLVMAAGHFTLTERIHSIKLGFIHIDPSRLLRLQPDFGPPLLLPMSV